MIKGNILLKDGVFDPENSILGSYLIEYTAAEDVCNNYVDFTIDVNADCIPCSIKDAKISKTITANGDGINDTFKITGLEYCNYTFDVMIFNRWGNKVFEDKNYQNDWGAVSPDNSLGSSGSLPTGTYYYIIDAKGEENKKINGYIYIGSN